jgi:hypothetical protein
VVLFSFQAAGAGLIDFNSPDFSSNSATRTQWLNAIGITLPDILVDFENLAINQNVHNDATLFTNLVITSSDEKALVQSDSSKFGDSNPIGTRALAHKESKILTLDFSSSPVDYVGFCAIDYYSFIGTAYFTDNSTAVFTEGDGTARSGDTAEFYGIFRNDLPRISMITFNIEGGDSEWGIDNIEYGVVPEPMTTALLLSGALLFLLKRK